MGLFNKFKNIFKSEDTVAYEKGLLKTRDDFTSKLKRLSKKYKKIDSDYFEELEEVLIGADLGAKMVINFIEHLEKRVVREKIVNVTDLNEIIVDEMFIMYVNEEIIVNKINYNENGPTVLLFIGVNGVGKTTTIGKIAHKLKGEGKKVLMVAGDTFRAGAVEQLDEWGDLVGVDIIKRDGADPSSVIYEGVEHAINNDYEVVLIDTAGRLHNKGNLMKELEKMNRVIKKIIPDAPHETLLVIDATTGQNAIVQANKFKEIVDISGLVLTKLDGTAKGGIVLAIKDEVGIPVKFVGLGEQKEDLKVFDLEKYIYGLFKDLV